MYKHKNISRTDTDTHFRILIHVISHVAILSLFCLLPQWTGLSSPRKENLNHLHGDSKSPQPGATTGHTVQLPANLPVTSVGYFFRLLINTCQTKAFMHVYLPKQGNFFICNRSCSRNMPGKGFLFFFVFLLSSSASCYHLKCVISG